MAVKRDRYHKKAATYYRKLSKDMVRLVTSNYVLSETCTRIRYDHGHAKARQFNALIQEAIRVGRLNLEWVIPAIHKQAWDIFENYADQAFSFVDCTSFVIAKRVGVKEGFGLRVQADHVSLLLSISWVSRDRSLAFKMAKKRVALAQTIGSLTGGSEKPGQTL